MVSGACLAMPAAPATATAQAVPPTTPSAPAFDALFATLNSPESVDMTATAWDRALDQLAALTPGSDPGRDLRLRSMYCSHTRWGTSPALARYIQAAMHDARSRGDLGSQARLSLCLASDQDLQGQSKLAIATLGPAIELARQAKDPLLAMQLLGYRGDLHSLLGDQARALLDYERAHQILQQAGLERLSRYLLSGTGMVYRRMGEYSIALEQFQKLKAALPSAATWEDHYEIAMQEGFLYTEDGHPDQGVRAFEQALGMAREHGTPLDRSAALTGLAQAQVKHGDFDSALGSIDRSEGLDGALFTDTDRGVNQLVRGEALAGLQQPQAALAHFDKALALLSVEGNPRYLAWLYEARSKTQQALGKADAALSDYRRFVELQRALDSKASRQQGLLVQLQANARQRELENVRLRQQQVLQAQQVDALLRVRRWQSTALVLGVLLLVTLAVLSAKLLRRTRQLRRIAMVDSLTHVGTRRSIYAAASDAVAHAHASGLSLSALVVDIDRFKSVNDRHGHPAGDKVLVEVARCCKASLRQRDLIGRAGGEEFLILCPDTDLEDACRVADRLLQAVRALRFDAVASSLRVTISIGAASLPGDDQSVDTLVAHADRALYAAKQGGRDRVAAYAAGQAGSEPATSAPSTTVLTIP